jgi:hypothetical protein
VNPRAKLALLCVAAGLVLAAATAHGRTWRVEQDGSGDFDTIQPAVDGSAPGDTILIGPGRYSETTLYNPNVAKGFFPKPVISAITVDDLTIIGVGSDQVVLAPDTPDTSPDGPMGIATYLWISELVIRGMAFEDFYVGLYSCGSVEVEQCEFRDSDTGIIYWDTRGLAIRACDFGNNYIGVNPMTANNILIESCSFRESTYGLASITSSNVIVTDSDFEDTWIAIDYQQGSSGAVHGCNAMGDYAAVNVLSYSNIYLSDNEFRGGYYSMASETYCTILAIANIFGGGHDATIAITKANAEFHGNHILRSDGRSVWLVYYPDTPAVTLDMTGNYWGTTDGDQIAGWIFDGHDDPSIQAFVNYEPFEQQPIGTEPATMGRVKAMYR